MASTYAWRLGKYSLPLTEMPRAAACLLCNSSFARWWRSSSKHWPSAGAGTFRRSTMPNMQCKMGSVCYMVKGMLSMWS